MKILKQKTGASLKRLLDSLFSKYIRLKYARNGMVSCYTCHRVIHWRKSQCGHFISRQHLATRWDENNCRPQCVGCNIFGGGAPWDFEEFLIKEIGPEKVTEIKSKRHQITKLNKQWYVDKIRHYTEKVAQLQAKLG